MSIRNLFVNVSGIILCAFLFLVAAGTSFANEKFLSAIDDLPLMNELDEIKGSAMEFDSPQGRVVEAMAMGVVDKDRVLAFYSATLPQLGWTQSKADLFSREGEVLKIEFPNMHGLSGSANAAGMTTVQYMLSPAQ